MSGDWMKIDLELSDKPEVHYIANGLNIDPDTVVGKLIRVWAWFDKHTEDGNAVGVTYSLVDRITGVSGFAEMMCLAGWLTQNDAILTMPKFDRHTSKSAKTRAITRVRVEKFRNASTVTKSVPEKRREEKEITPISPSVFDVFWQSYPKKVGKGAAEKAWANARMNGHVPEVMASLAKQKTSEQWTKDNGQFIPNPATWINQRRWEDELQTCKPYEQQPWEGAL